MLTMSSLAIIPARGGSKRIPRKNIRIFLGKPIIAYSIEAALKSEAFDEIIVSTDDKEIARIAKEYGARVPFFRSESLSSDITMTVPVIIEVLDKYKEFGKYFDYICCLYPCAPFVTADHLKEGMGLLINSDVDAVLPIVKFSYPPQRGLVIKNKRVAMLHQENYDVRSQDFEPYYHDAGQFYCLKSNSLRKERRLFCENTLPLIMQESEVQDIDTEDDWNTAEIKYKIMCSRKNGYTPELYHPEG